MAKTRPKKPDGRKIDDTALPAVDISKLVSGAQLQLLRLRKNGAVLITVPENPPELNQKIQVEVGSANAESTNIFVLVTFSLDGKDTLRIEATFEIVYEYDASTKVTSEQMVAFGHMIGVNNAWPYWREFVQSTTSRMGLPSLTLPLLRPPERPAKKAQKKPTQSNKKKHTPAKKKPRRS